MSENPIPELEWQVMEPAVINTNNPSMLELGNKANRKGVYKIYLESIGVNHTSVDWNGKDGALNLDLRQPLNLGVFDIVTNMGTTEHVSEQIPVWKNIHEAISLGGYLVCCTPAPGFWWWHGEYYPKQDFYTEFAKINGYVVEFMEQAHTEPHVNIYCRLKKVKDLPFSMPSDETMYINVMRPR